MEEIKEIYPTISVWNVQTQECYTFYHNITYTEDSKKVEELEKDLMSELIMEWNIVDDPDEDGIANLIFDFNKMRIYVKHYAIIEKKVLQKSARLV